jgi:ring-1,2-phenylacetyl-CoA epoxidase subunit PaaD
MLTTVSGVTNEKDIWRALDEVMDPELPVVSVVEMGIVREVELTGGEVRISITPTFSGCPALRVMQSDIEGKLRALGFEGVEVKTVLSPPWSSDWITDGARTKLKGFGIAPPQKDAGVGNVIFYEPTSCPYCDSLDTSIKNTFGPTLCKMIYYCNACQQPFEQFKAV